MNCIFLIDFPCVGEKGLEGIDELDRSDVVHIFYNALCKNITYETLMKIRRSKAAVILNDNGIFTGMISVQTASLFGQLIRSSTAEHVYMITKRKSLLSLHAYGDEYVPYGFAQSIEKCDVQKTPSVSPEKQALADEPSGSGS